MPSLKLIAFLISLGLFALALLWSTVGSVFFRRRLVRRLESRHPEIWARAVSSADHLDPLGRRMATSSLLIRLVAEAERGGRVDAELHRNVRLLKSANLTLIATVLVMVALALVSKLWPR
jgi:hypothetical protein